MPSTRGKIVPFAWLPDGNSRGLLEVKEMVRHTKTGLELGLQAFKEQPPQKLEKLYWYAIRLWSFVGACLGTCRYYFFNGNEG